MRLSLAIVEDHRPSNLATRCSGVAAARSIRLHEVAAHGGRARLRACPATSQNPQDLASSGAVMICPLTPAGDLRRDQLWPGYSEDRQAEAGEMVQRLVDADQRPEPRMPASSVTPKREAQIPLSAVDRDVNRRSR